MAEIRSDWLESGEEQAIEPGLRVCDPHHHLWDHPRSRYLAVEFTRDARGHGVEKSVFVECGSSYRPDGPEPLRPVGETEFVERIACEVAAGSGSLELNAGIVGHANLLLGEAVDEVLEAHLAASPERFRGIRHSAAWHESDAIRESHSKPPPHMLTLPKFHAGFARLRRYELSFDDDLNDADSTVEAGPVRVAVDEKSALYLVGTTLDFVDTLQESGFKMVNPNAKSTCGCGESFGA